MSWCNWVFDLERFGNDKGLGVVDFGCEVFVCGEVCVDIGDVFVCKYLFDGGLNCVFLNKVGVLNVIFCVDFV